MSRMFLPFAYSSMGVCSGASRGQPSMRCGNVVCRANSPLTHGTSASAYFSAGLFQQIQLAAMVVNSADDSRSEANTGKMMPSSQLFINI